MACYSQNYYHRQWMQNVIKIMFQLDVLNFAYMNLILFLWLLWLTFDDFLIFINLHLLLRREMKIYLMCEVKTHKAPWVRKLSLGAFNVLSKVMLWVVKVPPSQRVGCNEFYVHMIMLIAMLMKMITRIKFPERKITKRFESIFIETFSKFFIFPYLMRFWLSIKILKNF